jgi:SpoU rRNA methylase family enzyme
LGADLVVVSKETSSAAQSGVPEIEKMAFKEGRRVLYVPDIADAVELLSPDVNYMFVPKRLSETPIDYGEVARLLDEGKKVMLSFSGGTVAFALKELEFGKPVYIEGIDEVFPPSALVAITLYSLRQLRGRL